MQYIVDEHGVKTSVVVPYHLWGKINDKELKDLIRNIKLS